MKVKLTVAQYKQFDAENPWPKGAFVEDDTWTVNGEDLPDPESGLDPTKYQDTDVLTLEDGRILADSEGVKLPKHKTLASWIKAWQKSKNETTYQVNVDNSVLAAFELHVATFPGVKVMRKVV